MIRTVVAATSVPSMVVETVVPALATIVVQAVMPSVLLHLMRTLLVIGRIITAPARLSDGGYPDRSCERE